MALFFHHSPPARSILIPIDRFSTLPVEIKLNILEHISFEEAARASISRTINWSEHPQVILDKPLFDEWGRWIRLDPGAWADKVTRILSNHHEVPIRKFILHIPDMQFKWALYINIWLSCLSKNSINKLSVDNWSIFTFKLSSLLFECSELTRLMLHNCAFYKSFGVFQNLRFLRFENIAFGSVKVGELTLSIPSLVQAELVDCTGRRQDSRILLLPAVVESTLMM
ncbi:uncharacterized protein LOC114268195 isoform X1 [Camellia sinensis]|uniref:uncharacterized protein LOC114268195 isoform X1 n=1 Tax=Camellia sinensis TaxID=4442 RepID=UPI001035D871|nr:uncharacterized protein LOC114268195 isoform X1 [Camellia sinensis]